MAFASSVQVSDPNNQGGAYTSLLVADLQTALADWSKYITGLGTLVVTMNFYNENGFSAASGSSTAFASESGLTDHSIVEEPSAVYELTTGKHVAGTTSDIKINVNLYYLASSYAAGAGADVYLFRHELTHGFGMNGLLDGTGHIQSNNGYTFADDYDQYVQTNADGSSNFVGPNAVSANGGLVELTVGNSNSGVNYYHTGNLPTDPLSADLMSDVPSNRPHQKYMSDVDVAILKDAGVPVTGLPGRAVAPVQTFVASDGRERLINYVDAGDAARAGAVLGLMTPSRTTVVDDSGTIAMGANQGALDDAYGEATVFGGTSGGQNVVAGDGGLVFVANGAGSGNVVAGAGTNQVFVNGSGAGWNIALGNGRNTVEALAGNDTVAAGTGGNLDYLGLGQSSVLSAGADTIIGGAGTSAVNVVGSGALVFAGAGGIVFANQSGVSTVVGNTGRLLVNGAAGRGLFFGGSSGGNRITAGAGAATILGGGAGDVLAAGGGAADLLGGGSGAETLTGAGTSGANTFYAGTGPDLIVGGAGITAIVAGTGNSSLVAGSGATLFVFNSARDGGSDTVSGFDPGRAFIALQGYGSAAASNALATASATPSGLLLGLADGTHILFQGIGSIGRASFV